MAVSLLSCGGESSPPSSDDAIGEPSDSDSGADADIGPGEVGTDAPEAGDVAPPDADLQDAAEPDRSNGDGLTALPGSSDEPAELAVPWLDYVPRVEDYTTDHPESPDVPIAFNVVILAFAVGTTVGEANALLADLGAEIVGGIPGVSGEVEGLLVLRLPTDDHVAMMDVLDELGEDPIVAVVVPDIGLEDKVIAGDNGARPEAWEWTFDPDKGNWGHELLRVPQMWNLNDVIREADGSSAVGIVDSGFDFDHPDLEIEEHVGARRETNHGTHVAGIVGATFDNGLGVDGVNPFVRLFVASKESLPTTASVTWGVRSLLTSHREISVINLSQGFPWDTTNALQIEWAGQMGQVFATLMRSLASDGALPVVAVSSGNESDGEVGPQHTRYLSPFSNAALEHGIANIIIVEALADASNPTRADYSNFGGHLSAPGSAVWSTLEHDDSIPDRRTDVCWPDAGCYGSRNGTSMSAPMLAGVVSYLYALNPELARPTLDNNPVLDLLIANSFPVRGLQAANRIDAFAAAMAMDGIAEQLVDIDDGTLDGNDRTTLDDEHGDGLVDMADFRRFRDWYVYINRGSDGRLDHLPHPKMDVNGNGELEGGLGEDRYPRADFNGNGRLSRTNTSEVPDLGAVTDLEVLQAFFDDDYYRAEELDDLLDSGDLRVNADTCRFHYPDAVRVVSSIRASGESVPSKTHTHTEDEPDMIYTVETGDYIALVQVLGDVAVDFELEERFTVGLAEDIFWEPACGPVLDRVDPDNGQPGDVVLLVGRGLGTDPEAITLYFQDRFAVFSPVETTIDSVVRDSESPSIIGLLFQVPPAVANTDEWEIWVELDAADGPLVSNRLSFTHVAGNCIVDLHELSGGTDSRGLDVNSSGDVLWSASVDGTTNYFMLLDDELWTVPCPAQRMNDDGAIITFDSFWEPLGVTPEEPGACTELPSVDESSIWANAINNDGLVVGYKVGSGTSMRAMAWPDGVATRIERPHSGWGGMRAHDINSSGLIVGVAHASTSGIWTVGDYTGTPEIIVPGAGFIPVTAFGTILLNDADQILYTVDGQATLWEAGETTTLESVGAGYRDMNASAEIIISRTKVWLPEDAYGVIAGLYELNDFVGASGWTLTDGWATNDSGAVIGTGRHGESAVDHAVVLDLAICARATDPSPID